MPDIQKLIDDLVAKNPDVLKYVEWVKYVPQGQPPPEGWTHQVVVLGRSSGQDIRVAVKGQLLYAVLLDALLPVL